MDLRLKILFTNLVLSSIIIYGVYSVPETCLLPKSSGNASQFCNAELTMYYYNRKTYRCQKFIYNGCGGNENRYFTKQECETACPLTEEEKAKQDNINKIQKKSYLDNPLLQTSAVQRIDAAPAIATQAATTLQPPTTVDSKTKQTTKSGKQRRRNRKMKGKSRKRKNRGRSRGRSSRKRSRGKGRRNRGKSGRRRSKKGRGKSHRGRRRSTGKSKSRRRRTKGRSNEGSGESTTQISGQKKAGRQGAVARAETTAPPGDATNSVSKVEVGVGTTSAPK